MKQTNVDVTFFYQALHSHKKYILPKKVLFNGQTVTTAIFKDPVKGPIMLRKLNLDGDRQADLTVHVGVDRANKLIQYAPMNVTIAIFEWSEKHHYACRFI